MTFTHLLHMLEYNSSADLIIVHIHEMPRFIGRCLLIRIDKFLAQLVTK